LRILNYIFFLSIIILVGFFIAFRDINVGKDSVQYLKFFYNLNQVDYWLGRYEVLFVYFSYISYFWHKKVEFYFFSIYLVITLIYCASFSSFLSNSLFYKRNKILILYCILPNLFFSSWFMTVTTNGLRQGISLSFLYLGFSFFFKKKYLLCYFFLAIAIGFHSSSILAIPVLVAFLLSNRLFYLIFSFSILLYVTSFNELLVKFISDISGLGIYDILNSYFGEEKKWAGFDLRFFIYSLFWPVFYLMCRKFLIKEEKELLPKIIKLYCGFLIPFFCLGFMPYSNRFALLAWFFIPTILSSILYFSRVKMHQKKLFITFISGMSMLFISIQMISLL